MAVVKINDRKMLDLINEGLSQAATARKIGVTPAAVCKRLQEIRGRATKAIVASKLEAVIDKKIDAIEQLQKINNDANWLLDHVMGWIKGDENAIQVLEHSVRRINIGTKKDPQYIGEYKFKDPHEIAIKVMAQIKEQLKLQLDIFQAMYDLRAAEDFQKEVLEAIGQVDPSTRKKIIESLNEKRSVRHALKFC